jgi:transcriptional regulator of arginine metabolism
VDEAGRMKKSYRQGQILKLIQGRSLRTQEDLARALRGLGVAATQVTLSRDIRELGLIKTPQGYAKSTDTGGGQGGVSNGNLADVAREFLQDVRVAQNLVVLRTPPAHANAVAAALDRADWREVCGTVAGDDTVLVVAATSRSAGLLRRRLLHLLK